jgi:glycine cleavage system transcriptional repressor
MKPNGTDVVFVISIMSKDQIGIIASVSEKIRQIGGNIADIRQSVLCGYFTMILLVAFPQGIEIETVESKFSEVNQAEEPRLLVSVKFVPEQISLIPSTFPENTYVLTVTGLDQIGFVAAVTKFCTEKQINILDLSTTRKNDQYVMILFIDMSRSEDIASIRDALDSFGRETGFEVVIQHYNIFRAINEINLPVI